jgi:hypothetical protein
MIICVLTISLIGTNLPLPTFLPLQGGGQEGDGVDLAPDLTHPHPNPPLEGEGDFSSGRLVLLRNKIVPINGTVPL